MKKTFTLLLLATALVGCRSNYDVTLSNGSKFTGVSKPRLDKKTGQYRFKTADGQVSSYYRDNIRLIEPHEEPKKFKPKK